MSANPASITPIVLSQPEIPGLAEIGKQVESFRSIAAGLTDQVSRAVISSEKTFATGTDFLTLVKTNVDQLEILRKAVKKPIDAYAQTIQDIFLPIKAELDAANNVMRQRMLAYRQEQDRIVREEQDRIRREQEEAALTRAAELERQGNTAAANAVVEMAAAPLAAPQKTEGYRGSFGGKAGTRESWTAEVVNKREFLKSVLEGTTNFNLDDISVGQAALNKLATAVKVEGTKNGVKIIKNTGLNLRS